MNPSPQKCSTEGCDRPACVTDSVPAGDDGFQVIYERRPFCWVHGHERSRESTSRIEQILCPHGAPVSMMGECSQYYPMSHAGVEIHQGLVPGLAPVAES